MHVHNMQRQEEDYTMVRGIKHIEGKSIKSGTNFVTQKQTNGSTLEITDKTPLEKVIMEENVKSTIKPNEISHYLMTSNCTRILDLLVKNHR